MSHKWYNIYYFLENEECGSIEVDGEILFNYEEGQEFFKNTVNEMKLTHKVEEISLSEIHKKDDKQFKKSIENSNVKKGLDNYYYKTVLLYKNNVIENLMYGYDAKTMFFTEQLPKYVKNIDDMLTDVTPTHTIFSNEFISGKTFITVLGTGKESFWCMFLGYYENYIVAKIDNDILNTNEYECDDIVVFTHCKILCVLDYKEETKPKRKVAKIETVARTNPKRKVAKLEETKPKRKVAKVEETKPKRKVAKVEETKPKRNKRK